MAAPTQIRNSAGPKYQKAVPSALVRFGLLLGETEQTHGGTEA